MVALSALGAACLWGPGARADAAPPPGQVRFSAPSLFPSFSPTIRDYVVRCNDAPVTVRGHTSADWQAAIGGHSFRSGDFSEVVGLSAGRSFTIRVREVGRPYRYRYYVRCLPNDFPEFTFTRSGPVSPRFFSAERDFVPAYQHYGMIFDNHGVPIWWVHARTHATRVRADGTVLWFDRATKRWELHRLDGSLIRTLAPVGYMGDPHDLRLLGNGNHLVGAAVRQEHVDTSAHGGSSDATVINAELQEVSADSQLVWSWNSKDHVALAETGRHWPWAMRLPSGYDIAHWNSVEAAGGSVIASFRHFDAVYKIRKDTGEIVWKLGGTTTPESLEVRNDPRTQPLGAQHDARLLGDGTVSVFDNRTNLRHRMPRAARFRIDEAAGTATHLGSITDPDVPVSLCCGSARRLGNGQWLIAWGKDGTGRNTGLIGGYRANGERTFLLGFDKGFSHRAEPVPSGALSAADLRQAMDAMVANGP
jgi:hypothetical protein